MNLFEKAFKKAYLNEVFLLLNSMNSLSELTAQYKALISKYFTTKTLQPGEMLISQGEHLTNIYIVKKGFFSLSFIRNASVPVTFGVDHFLQYQELSKEHFSSERKYEIKGNFNYKEEDKLIVYCVGEIIGDIEWYLQRDNSLFNIKAGTQGGEVAIIDRDKFIGLITTTIKRFRKITERKMENFRDRLSLINRNKNDVCQITKGKIVRNHLLYQFSVTQGFHNNNSQSIQRSNSMPFSRYEKFSEVNESNRKKLNDSTSKIVKLTKTMKLKYNGENRKLLNTILDTNKFKGKEKTKIIKELLNKAVYSRNNKVNDKRNSFITDEQTTKIGKTTTVCKKDNGFHTLDEKKILRNRKFKINNRLFLKKDKGKQMLGLNFKSDLVKKFDLNQSVQTKDIGISVPLNKTLFLNKNVISGLLKEKYELYRSYSQEKLY